MDSSAARKPKLKTEAIAGITTFFTMAYIVIVNPQILSADGKTGMAFIGSDPVTFVKLGALGKPALLTILGLAISAFLMSRKNPFAFLVAIVAVTLIAWALGLVSTPTQVLSLPDFKSVFLKLDVLGA